MTPEVKRTPLSPAHPVFPFCRLSLSRASYPSSILSLASPLPDVLVALSRQRRAPRTSPCTQPSFFQFRELFFFDPSFNSASTIHVKDAVAYWHYD
jgi:hypothetical protein